MPVRPSLRSLAVLATVTLPLAAVPAVATGAEDRAAPPAGAMGAPGIGDPYFPLMGNGGYDVADYRLDLRYRPVTDALAGVATIRAQATADLSRFNLDLQGLEVSAVRVDGAPAAWTQARGHELLVTPANPLRDGQGFRVVVRYGGVPQLAGIPGTSITAGFYTTDDGAMIAGEPEVAATWFPVNDHPQDKATYTFNWTVPQGVRVVANGRLMGRRDHHGLTTYSWREAAPMASYLATASIGRLRTHHYRTPSGISVYDAVDPVLYRTPVNPDDPASPTFGENIDRSFRQLPEVLGVLEDAFGPYPFRQAGGIVDVNEDMFFALETQTRPIYSQYFFEDPESGPLVVAHENAHQWFGDHVSVHRWRDVWLNEGPATYAEWLWIEHAYGVKPQRMFDTFYTQIPARDPFWKVQVARPGLQELFGSAVYDRGALTLQALRHSVGSRLFFTILQRWNERFGGGDASTKQFIRLSERVTGRDLSAFFDDWVYSTTKPPSPYASRAAAARHAQSAQDPRTRRAVRILRGAERVLHRSRG